MADSRKNLQLLVFRLNHQYKAIHCITIHSIDESLKISDVL